MTIDLKNFLLCPVPDDQKPIYQYIQLREGPFSSLPLLEDKKYQKNLFFIFLFFFLLSCFFNNSFFNHFEIILQNLLIANCFLSFFLFVLFRRWVDVQDRFNNSRVFYEESSWYDGQSWEKPIMILKNDKLISSQKIQPIIEKILK
jgi:hypothetical protein